MTTVEGRTVDSPAWGLVPAPPKSAKDWLHEPRPPFRVQGYRRWMGDCRVAVPQTFDHFDDAMEAVIEFIPPSVGSTAMVLDESFTMVFCVDAALLRMAANGTIVWLGVQAAYAWLEERAVYNMIDLAMMEGQAMRHAGWSP